MDHVNFILCIIALFPAQIQSQLMTKSVTLTPYNTSTDGAMIQTHIEEVTTMNNTWITRVISQNNWQFTLLLNDSWGFHPNVFSSIQITIDSPSVTTGKSTFDSLLFAFTTDDNDYISSLITMNESIPNKIYPSCNNTSPQVPAAKGNMHSLSSLYRECNTYGTSCTNNWHDMKPINIPNMLNGTPFSFKLSNYPSLNTLRLSFYHSVFGNELTIVQHCAFTSIQANNGLKMYIGANNANDTLQINSFTISAISTQINEHVKNPSFQPIGEDRAIASTQEAALAANQFMVHKTNKLRLFVIPMTIAAVCVALLVLLYIMLYIYAKIFTDLGHQPPKRDRMGFEHIDHDSFSSVSGYFIRAHYRDDMFMYNMISEESTSRDMDCAHWKANKYDTLIDIIENEFHLHCFAFRLYEIVNGKKEDINSIDDIIVAFDCVTKDSNTIDIYVAVEEQEHCHSYSVISRIERDYLEERILEMIEITADVNDKCEASHDANDTMDYYD